MTRATLSSKESASYTWWLAAAIWCGAVSNSFSVRMTNIATPRMMSFFQVDIATMQRMQTSGAITRAVVPSLAGWLGGMVGMRRLYIWSILFRTVACFFQGSAWSFPSLLTQPMHEDTTRLAQHIAGELTRSGAGTVQTALEQAWTMLRRQMTQEATLSAYQDLFRMSAILGLMVIAPVFFLHLDRSAVHQQKQRGGRRRGRIAFA